MRWYKKTVLLLLVSPVCAAEGYFLGIGAEVDNADAAALSVSGELGIGENTWLSATAAKSTADLPRGGSIDTVYGEIGLDHWFDPVGVRLSAAYWGDSDFLDSDDVRASIYWRGDRLSLSGEVEFREFTFDIFRDNLILGQDFQFHANGAGLSARFRFTDSFDLSFSGMHYDYNVDLRRAANRPIVDFLSVSRLSLVNSLTDYRLRVGLGVDVGEQRWSFDLATSKGEADTSTTRSATVRFLTPVGKRADIEFGLGVDDTDDYGSAILFSIFAYFYG